LSNPENRKILFDFKEEMNDDKETQDLTPSKFGLVQITRQRVRPEVNIKLEKKIQRCECEIEAPILIIDRINLI
jgi:ribonuclease G